MKRQRGGYQAREEVSEIDLQISAKKGPEAAQSSAEMQSFPSERTKPALQVMALPSPFLVQLDSPASQGVQVLSSAMGRNIPSASLRRVLRRGDLPRLAQ